MLGVFLIYYSYHQFSEEQLEEVSTLFKKADYTYIFLAMILGLLSDFIRAYRWNILLNPLGHKVKLSNSIMAVGAAYLMNLVIPRGGEVTRAIIVNKYDKVPMDHGFGTIIAERAIDFIILLLLIAITLLIQFDVVKDFLADYITPDKFIYLALVSLGLLLIAFLVFKKSQHNLVLKIKKFVSGIIEGCLSIFKSQKKLKFFFLTFLIWGIYILMFYVTVFALPETENITFPVVITAFVIGSLTIAFTNGGFGVFPFVMAEILFLYDIERTTGTAFGWLSWISQTVLVIIYGLISLWLLPYFNKEKNS